jgi:ADP-heptose:LPS heptosyltransferase
MKSGIGLQSLIHGFMRILALIPGGIAEQLQFFPTLETLCKQYPNSKIDVVAAPEAIGAYRVSTIVAEKIPFNFAGRNSLADWGNLLGIMRDREYDIAVVPDPSWGVSFLLWLSGIPSRIGFVGCAGANLLTATVALDSTQSRAAQYHQLLTGLGLQVDCPLPTVNLSTADLDWVDGERKRQNLTSGGYVVFYSPDAGYPPNSWETILQDFQTKQPTMPLVWVQDGQNEDLTTALSDRLSSLKLVRPTNLGQTIALLAGASLVLTAEGPMLQAAIAANTFTLGLFSISDPQTAMPPNERFIGIKSPTDKLADITPSSILAKVWPT